jgi:hypothetical protein
LSDDRREPPRQVGHFALLIFVGLLIVASLALSRRPPVLASLPHIAFVAEVPRHRHEDQLAAFAQVYGAFIPKTDWRPDVAVLLERDRPQAMARLRLGYWVRSWTFLGLPMFAVKEGGYTVYLDRPGHYRAVALGKTGEAELIKQTGSRFWGSWWPAYWRYCWGLLAPMAVGAWIWLELRWQARRRMAMGLI